MVVAAIIIVMVAIPPAIEALTEAPAAAIDPAGLLIAPLTVPRPLLPPLPPVLAGPPPAEAPIIAPAAAVPAAVAAVGVPAGDAEDKIALRKGCLLRTESIYTICKRST